MRVVPGREDDVVFVTRHISRPLPEAVPDAVRQIEQEISHLFILSTKLLLELETLLADPKKYSPQVRLLRNYGAYLDSQISEAALDLSKRDLSMDDAAYLARLVRISKLGQVLADQTGELDEIIHQIQEKGIVLSETSKDALQRSLIPCGMNLKTLQEEFPVLSDAANEAMRRQDDILRETITRQYRDYLSRFAAKKTPSGSEFSRVLFQIEGMAGTIREIRKTARLRGMR